MADSPVQAIEGENGARAVPPEEGTALCLSGGGYRAMLFHVGSLWRLYEAEQLRANATLVALGAQATRRGNAISSW